jgi:arylsulfatase A-like enzyme
MNRRNFLGSAVAAGLARCGPESGEDTAKTGRPSNVVFVLTDDQAPNTLGAYGNREIRTPVSDRLCADGAMMTQAFCTTPVCSPSRATLFTGQIPSQHGIHDWIRDENEGEGAVRFLDGEATLSQTLADAGYRVGLSGKWHMGDSAVPQQGFDYWFAMPTGGNRYQDPLMYWQGEKKEYPGYTTDVVTDKAIEFIESAARDPFFCFVSYNAPHTPYSGTPQKYLDMYKDSPFETFPGEPLNEPIAHSLSKANVGNRESKMHYYGMITAIDENVGRIVRRLDDMKLSNDTLVVFLSDHGFMLEHHGLWGKGNTSWPFNMYDESLLVPAYFYHPGRIPGGQRIGAMTSFYDFAPTMLDYCGAPALKSAKPLPGRSYAALLEGREIADWPEAVYGEYAYCRCIRTKSGKFIHRTEGFPGELYDLANDPGERRNLVDDPNFAERERELKAQMEEWFGGLGCADYDMWKHAKQKVLPSVERVDRG